MIPRWVFAALMAPITVAALLGFLATLAIHVAAHLHVIVPREQWQAFAYGLFPLWVTVVLISITERPPNNVHFWDFLLRGTPRWMGRTAVWLLVYAGINMLLMIAALMSGGLRGLGSEWDAEVQAWGVTGHLLVFYWTGFSVFYAKLVRLTHHAPRCPNGHAVDADHRYCTKCGAKVEGFFEYEDVG